MKKIIAKFKIDNWNNNIPSNILEYICTPAPRQFKFTNFIFQKILRINVDSKFMVHFTSIVTCPERIKIGKNVCKTIALSGGCYYGGINGIEIGDDTLIGPGVKIISANHDPSKLDDHVSDGPIKIGKNCWLGANSIILPGVILGDNTTIAAGSIVTKSYPEGNIILIGAPAKPSRAISRN